MKIELREDSVHISGYVNAVERNSKILREKINGTPTSFYERIKRGVFTSALKRNDDVKVLLNHDSDRELATTRNGSAELREDNIGLHAEVEITDAEVVKAARENRLVGWSFGFYPNAFEMGDFDGDAIRTITDMDLIEVSILDNTKTPAYDGTLIEARAVKELCLRDADEEPSDDEPCETKEEGPREDELGLKSELVALKEMIDELLAKVEKNDDPPEEPSDAPFEETEEPEEEETEDENRSLDSEQGGKEETSVELIEKQAREDTTPTRFDYTTYEERLNALRKERTANGRVD